MLWAALRQAVMRIFLGMTAVALLRVLLLTLPGNRLPVPSDFFFGISACVVAMVILTARFWQTRNRFPQNAQTAQHLDAATNAHNLIATAWYLRNHCRQDLFAALAVQDGLNLLVKVCDRQPHFEMPIWTWRRYIILFLMTCIFYALGSLLAINQSAPDIQNKPAIGQNTIAFQSQSPRVIDPDHQDNTLSSRPRQQPQSTIVSVVGSESSPLAEDKNPVAAKNLDTQNRTDLPGGKMGGQMSQNLSSGQSAQLMRQAVSDDNPSSKSKANTNSRRRKTNPQDSKTLKQSDSENSSLTGHGQGNSASQQTAAHTWSQSLRTQGEENPEQDNDDMDAEDTEEGSAQRGGIQPMLKDRNVAPSRELGITGGQKKPGTGRGGPSQPKKSRGTASLVLAVPVPDFVKGRLGPGRTKVVHEQSQPQTQPGDPARTFTTSDRSRPESPIPAESIPSEYQQLIRQYLLALHNQPSAGDDTEKKQMNP